MPEVHEAWHEAIYDHAGHAWHKAAHGHLIKLVRSSGKT